MSELKFRHLLIIPLIVGLVAISASCSGIKENIPLTDFERLMKEKQDRADFEALQLERKTEQMSDSELSKGIVYEPEN